MGDPDAPPLELEQILRVLGRHGVRYIVVGGVAALLHGAARLTTDLDLVPEWSDDNLGRLAAALKEIGARLRVEGSEPVAFPLDADALRRFELSTWRTTHGDLDILLGIPTVTLHTLRRYDELGRRAATLDAFGAAIVVADLDDVIDSKRATGRDPDLAALPELYGLRDRLAGG